MMKEEAKNMSVPVLNHCCGSPHASSPARSSVKTENRLSRDVVPLRYHLQFNVPYHNVKKHGGDEGLKGLATHIESVAEIFCTTRTHLTDESGNVVSTANFNNIPNNDLFGTEAFASSNATSFKFHSFGLELTSVTLRATNTAPVDRSHASAHGPSSAAAAREGIDGGDPNENSGHNASAADLFETVAQEPLPSSGPIPMSIELPDGVHYVPQHSESTDTAEVGVSKEIHIIVTEKPQEEMVEVATADGAKLPDNFSLLIYYKAPLSNSAYNSNIGAFVCDSENGNFISTQLEPTLSRSLYPCFDEPTFKANFKLCLFVHPSYQAVSSTAVKSIHRIPKSMASGHYDPVADEDPEENNNDSDSLRNDSSSEAHHDLGSGDYNSGNAAVLSAGSGIGGAGAGLGSVASGGSGFIIGDTNSPHSTTTPAVGPTTVGDLLGGVGTFASCGGLTLSLPVGTTTELNNLGGGVGTISSTSSPLNLGTTPPALLSNVLAGTNSNPTGDSFAGTDSAAVGVAAAGYNNKNCMDHEAAIIKDTWKYRYTFFETPKIPPCIIAFATGDFHVIETQTKRGLSTRVIFPKTNNSNSGLYAVDLLKKAVEFYEGFFNFALPVTKIDIVALKEMRHLGMENWGMITLHQNYTLVDEKTSVERRQRIARLIGHEVAHQWFGNIASIRWWDEIWLKEGFCRYLEFVFVQQLFPKWHIWGEFITKIGDVSLCMDCDPTRSHPVLCSDASDDPRRIFDLFDTISYGKGASILRMLASLVGDKTMGAALSTLVHRHMYGNFTTADFLECVKYHYGSAAVESGAGGADIGALVEQWISVPNHPLLYVDIDPEGNYKVSQYEMCDLRSGLLPDLVEAGIVKLPYYTQSSSAETPLSTGNAVERREVSSSPTFAGAALSPVRNSYSAATEQSLSRRDTGKFQFDPSEVFKHSDFTIPIRAVTLVQGQTSSSRFFFISNNVTNIQMGGGGGGGSSAKPVSHVTSSSAGGVGDLHGSVLYFNFNGCGVFRCDFTTKLWDQIFAVAPYLTHIDRLVITNSLFRFRTIHMGVSAPCPSMKAAAATSEDDASPDDGVARGEQQDGQGHPLDPQQAEERKREGAALPPPVAEDDRCTLLLKWLLNFSAGHPRQLNASAWSVIATELKPIVYFLKGSNCWEELCQFVHHIFTPLIVDGHVSLSPRENAADFQATRCISSETCFDILHLLAITKYAAFDDDARAVFRWVVSSIATVSGLGAAAAGIETDLATNKAEHKTPFDIKDPAHRMRAHAALEFLCERGHTTEWWVMVSICLKLTGMKWEQLVATPRSHLPAHPHQHSLSGGGAGAASSSTVHSGPGVLTPTTTTLNSILDPLGENAALLGSENSNPYPSNSVSNSNFNNLGMRVGQMFNNLSMIYSPPSDISVEVDPSLVDSPAEGAETAAPEATSAHAYMREMKAAQTKKANRQAFLQLFLPAVFALEDWSTFPPMASLALRITGLTTPMASAVVRNVNLMLEMLALGKQRISTKFLLSFCSLASTNCAHFELIAKLREVTLDSIQTSLTTAEKSGDPAAILAAQKRISDFAEISRAMDLNVAWVEYVVPHYGAYLQSLRQTLNHARTRSEIAVGTPVPSYLSSQPPQQQQALHHQTQAPSTQQGAHTVGGAAAASAAPAISMPPLCSSVVVGEETNELEI